MDEQKRQNQSREELCHIKRPENSDGNILDVQLEPLRIVSSFARNDTASDHQQAISFLENGSRLKLMSALISSRYPSASAKGVSA